MNRKSLKRLDQNDRPWQQDDEQDTNTIADELFPASIGMSSKNVVFLLVSMLIHPIDWSRVHQYLHKLIEENHPNLFNELSLPECRPIDSIESLIDFLHEIFQFDHQEQYLRLDSFDDDLKMILILLDRYRRSFISV